MSEIKFPCFVYHRTKPAFICPSQEFLNSLTDAKEYEFEPFTGPRKPEEAKKLCKECLKHKLRISDLEIEAEELRSESERLRIALKMAENKLAVNSSIKSEVKLEKKPKKD